MNTLEVSRLKQDSIPTVAALQALLAGRHAKELYEGLPSNGEPTKVFGRVIGYKDYELLLADLDNELREPVPTGVAHELHEQFVTIKNVCFALAESAFAGNVKALSILEETEAPKAEQACKEILDAYDKGLLDAVLELGGTDADVSELGIPGTGFDRARAEAAFDRLEKAKFSRQ